MSVLRESEEGADHLHEETSLTALGRHVHMKCTKHSQKRDTARKNDIRNCVRRTQVETSGALPHSSHLRVKLAPEVVNQF
jgi:hypothetical protein